MLKIVNSINLFNSDFIQTMNRMQNSKFEFFLTGSRLLYPSKISYTSDYDFYVQNSTAVIVFLESIGFNLEIVRNYLDINCEYVYRKIFVDFSHIDIQVRKDVQLHHSKVQKLLNLGENLCYKLFTTTSMTEKTEIWNNL